MIAAIDKETGDLHRYRRRLDGVGFPTMSSGVWAREYVRAKQEKNYKIEVGPNARSMTIQVNYDNENANFDVYGNLGSKPRYEERDLEDVFKWRGRRSAGQPEYIRYDNPEAGTWFLQLIAKNRVGDHVNFSVYVEYDDVIFEDDFESDKNWELDPHDFATTGRWERADAQSTYAQGDKQLGESVSGSHNLVTGGLSGSRAGAHDIDNGHTSIYSPEISLPDLMSNQSLQLSLSYYLAHLSNSSSEDYLEIEIQSPTRNRIVWTERGSQDNDNAVWNNMRVGISDFAGQNIRIKITAADESNPSLVEAGIDDVVIKLVQGASDLIPH